MEDNVLDDGFLNVDDLDEILSVDTDIVDSESDFSPDSPYVSVSRVELWSVIRTAMTFPSKSTIYFGFQKSNGKLHVHSNNKDVYFDAMLNILNDTAPDATGSYFLNVPLLAKLVSSYTKFVFSFDENQKLYFETPYSKIRLETFALDMDQVATVGTLPSDLNWKPFQLSKGETRVFKNLFAFTVKTSDNKVLVRDNGVEAFCTLYQHRLELLGSKIDEPYILRRIDIPTLVEINEGELNYALTADRIYFQFALGTVSFVRLPYVADEYLFPKSFTGGETYGEITFDIKMLRKALGLSTTLGVSVVSLISENDTVYLLASDKARFKVGSGKLSEEFTLTVELLIKLVATIDVSEVYIRALVTELGLDMYIEKESKIVRYSLSKTTVGQAKRTEKVQNKIANRAERREKLAEKGKLVDNLVPSGSLADEFGL